MGPESAAHGADSGHTDLRGVLPAGTSLRGYELKSILGQGAFGITYRARDLTLHRDVAIKEYLPTSLALREGRTTVLPRSPDHAEQFAWGRERFLEEARTLARLDRTPAIVRVHDFLEANGTAYMVMALIEGETLNKRLLREQRLTPEAVDRLVFPLLDGLEEVHAIGFLHRDIKPANIMVDSHGRPTLIDFGASRAAMAERSSTLTAIFTPGYAAAEQFTSSELGPWSDIYGLAATLYHAIAGRVPPSSIDRILKDTYQPLSELRPEGYSPALLAGVDAGLAIRVDERPQSIAEWRPMLQPPEPSALEATRIARKPRRLSRAASKTRRAGITIRAPALWGTVAAAIVLLAGGGYLALTANPTATVSTAALNLSVEQLEQALAERRKADALVAEKRRLEEEARQKAETEAEAKRQADVELAKARQARQKAEQELVQLKADIAARRQADTGQRDQAPAMAQRAAEEAARGKAEAEAAALRDAEEEAAKKAAADAAAKHQADQALAIAEAQRKQAEADARAKAAAETAAVEAQRKAEADRTAAAVPKFEEEAAAERSLRLEPADRQRLQVALTSLGFDTHGDDGVFGPRSREMIGRWQKARNQPATGFLTRAQQQALLKEAVATLSKHDEQKKAKEDVTTRTIAAAPLPAPDGPTTGSTDGLWRGAYECGRSGNFKPFALNLEVPLKGGSGTWYTASPSPTNDQTVSVKVSIDGTNVSVVRAYISGQSMSTTPLSGQLEGDSIRARNSACTMVLTRGGLKVGIASLPAAQHGSSAEPASPALPSPDGSWRGAYKCESGQPPGGTAPFAIDLGLRLTNGSAIWRTPDPSPINGHSFDVAVSVVRDTASVVRTVAIPLLGSRNTLMGRYDGNTINVAGRERSTGRMCTLALTRS